MTKIDDLLAYNKRIDDLIHERYEAINKIEEEIKKLLHKKYINQTKITSIQIRRQKRCKHD
jgi:hypothetical protein